MKRFIPFLPILLILLGSCSDKEPLVLDDKAYFPLTVGFYQVYEVTLTTYSAFNPPASLTYELKQEIVNSFENGEGGTTFVIHRHTRDANTAEWEYVNTWSARMDGQYALLQEEDNLYVKLIFPLQKNARWNGNTFAALEEDEYTLEKFLIRFTVSPGIEFENAVVVNQNDEVSLAYVDQRTEVYAPGRGLVFKESKVWSYNCSGGTCTGQITGGYHVRQLMKEYGEH